MRIFAFIWCIYIFSLAILPCDDHVAPINTNNSIAMVSATHSHPDAASDFCSPFCTCHCCSSNFVVEPIATNALENQILPINEEVCPLYTSTFIPKYVGSIWQPPKINA